MKSVTLEWALKIAGMVFVFIVPIIYLIDKFDNKIVVESTENSMPIPILLIVTAMIVVAISWLFSQVLNLIKDKPFGFGSILFFGVFMLAISFLGNMWLGKIEELITVNTQAFLSDIGTYKSAIFRVMLYEIIGLGLAACSFVVKLNRK